MPDIFEIEIISPTHGRFVAKMLAKYREAVECMTWNLRKRKTNSFYLEASSERQGQTISISLGRHVYELSGRPLFPGQVVTHRDGDNMNCLDGNLIATSSQIVRKMALVRLHKSMMKARISA